MNDHEIMDMDHEREEKRKRELWPQDDGWVECCKECWFPCCECRCGKDKRERE